MSLKRCQACGEFKPRNRFNHWRGKPTGKCKRCNNASVRRNKAIKQTLWWLLMVVYFDGRCARCGNLSELTPDHIVATTRGGGDNPLNIQPMCARCNSIKGTDKIDYRPPELIEVLKVYDSS